MTWRTLWTRMVYRNLRAYAGYVLTATFAVFLLYSFQSLGEGMREAVIIYGRRDYLLRMLSIMQGFTYVLAVFLVLYFHRLLIQAESKGLGLLATFGMEVGARRRLVMLESGVLGALALLMGIGLGMLFEPLFLLAASVLLKMPQRIAYVFHPQALLTTVAFFAVLFAVEGVFSAWWAVRRWPKQLFAAVRAVEIVRRPSWPKATAGLAFLASAYVLAGVYHTQLLVRGLYAETAVEQARLANLWLMVTVSILVLAVWGSYWVLAEGLRFLTRRRLVRGGLGADTLVVRARIAASLKGHAGSGTVIATLFAIVLTGLSLLAGAQAIILEGTYRQEPIILQITHVQNDRQAIRHAASTFREALENAGFAPVEELEFTTVRGTVSLDEGSEVPVRRISDVQVISRTHYQCLTAALEGYHPSFKGIYPQLPELETGEGIVIRPRYDPEVERVWGAWDIPPLHKGMSLKVTASSENGRALESNGSNENPARASLNVRLVDIAATPANLFDNSRTGLLNTLYLVVDDTSFGAFAQQARAEEKTIDAAALFYPRWKESYTLVDPLVRDIEGDDQYIDVRTLTTAYAGRYQYVGMLLFTLTLVAVLFLLASGATVYFKVQERHPGDAQQVAALRRLGATRGQVARVFRCEMAALLFAPLGISGLHSIFALYDSIAFIGLHAWTEGLNLSAIVWPTFVLVAAAVASAYALFGWWVSGSYVRRLWRG